MLLLTLRVMRGRGKLALFNNVSPGLHAPRGYSPQYILKVNTPGRILILHLNLRLKLTHERNWKSGTSLRVTTIKLCMTHSSY